MGRKIASDDEISVLDKPFKNLTHLFSHLDDAYSKKSRRPLHAVTMLPRQEVTVSDVQRYANKRGLKFDLEEITDSLYRFNVLIKTASVKGILVTTPGWWIMLSDNPGAEVKRIIVDSFIGRHLFRFLQATYMPPKTFLDYIDALSLVHDNIMIDEASFSGESVTVREWHKRPLPYVREAAEKLQQKNDGHLNYIRVRCMNDNEISCKIKLTSKGQVSLIKGPFSEFYADIITSYATYATKTSKAFSGKARKITDKTIQLHPLIVHSTKEYRKKDLDRIREDLVSSYATFVTGSKSLLIAQLADRRDGSSFDVYMRKKGEIRIVPMETASAAAFLALFALLSDALTPFKSTEFVVHSKPVVPIHGAV